MVYFKRRRDGLTIVNSNRLIKTFISISIILAIWSFVSYKELINSYILPSPYKVVDTFIKLLKSGEIFDNICVSYIRVLKGFSISTLLAFTLAMIKIVFPKFSDYYE